MQEKVPAFSLEKRRVAFSPFTPIIRRISWVPFQIQRDFLFIPVAGYGTAHHTFERIYDNKVAFGRALSHAAFKHLAR